LEHYSGRVWLHPGGLMFTCTRMPRTARDPPPALHLWTPGPTGRSWLGSQKNSESQPGPNSLVTAQHTYRPEATMTWKPRRTGTNVFHSFLLSCRARCDMKGAPAIGCLSSVPFSTVSQVTCRGGHSARSVLAARLPVLPVSRRVVPRVDERARSTREACDLEAIV